MAESYGERLRRLIGDRPRSAIARRAKISPSALDKLLADKVQSPRDETNVRLAKVLGEAPYYLRTGKREREVTTVEELEVWLAEMQAELVSHLHRVIQAELAAALAGSGQPEELIAEARKWLLARQTHVPTPGKHGLGEHAGGRRSAPADPRPAAGAAGP